MNDEREAENPRVAVRRYLKGELSAQELIAFDARLQYDVSLRPTIEEELKGRAEDFGLFGEPEPLPVSHEMLSAYVDGELDEVDREIVESAVEIEPVLAAELRELYALRSEMAQLTPKSAPVEAGKPSLLQAVLARLRSPSVWAPAGGLLAIVIVAAGVLSRPREAAPTTVAMVDHHSTDLGPPTRRAVQPTPPTLTKPTTQSAPTSRGQISRPPAPSSPPKSTEPDHPTQTVVASNLKAHPTHEGLPAGYAGVAFPDDVRQFTSMGGSANETATLGDSPTGRLVGPIATVIRSKRPTLRWTSFGADSYMVRLTDETTGDSVPGPDSATGLSWSPSADLKPGHVYSWSVQGIEAGTPTETLNRSGKLPARFKVLSESGARKLRTAMKRAGKDAALQGGAMAELGLFEEAEPILRKARGKAKGADKEAIDQLLKRVRNRS